MTDPLSNAQRLDLAELAVTYAVAVDERDWDRLGSLFTAEAVLVSPDPPRALMPVQEASGRDAIVAAVRQLDGFARTVHHVTGSVWKRGEGDLALGRTTAVAHHVEDAEPTRSFVWHLIYSDRARWAASGWLFERRELTVAMIETRPIARVLPFDAGTTY